MTGNSDPTQDITLAQLLSDGVFVDGDWVESKDQDPAGEVRLIQLADIGDGVFRDRSSRFLTESKARELRCTFLEEGDILVSRMPEPLGRACIFPGVGQAAVTVVDACIIRPNKYRVRPEWLVKAINSPGFRDSMQQFVRGTTRQRISRTNLATLQLRIPDIDEQLATAKSIERLESKRVDASKRLDSARRALDQFRHAATAAACSGRLSANWHPERASAEDELPAGWMYQTVEALAADVPRAIQSGPFGSNLKHSEFQPTGRLVIGIDNVLDGEFTLGSQHRISAAKFKELQKYEARPLDVLITVMSTVGRVCVVPRDVERAIITKHVYRITVDQTRVDPHFLMQALRGHPRVREQIFHQVRGQTRPGINGQIVKGLLIALPPIEEQHEIVRRLAQLLTHADELQRRVDNAAGSVERSKQAVLANAFRDELIGAG